MTTGNTPKDKSPGEECFNTFLGDTSLLNDKFPEMDHPFWERVALAGHLAHLATVSGPSDEEITKAFDVDIHTVGGQRVIKVFHALFAADKAKALADAYAKGQSDMSSAMTFGKYGTVHMGEKVAAAERALAAKDAEIARAMTLADNLAKDNETLTSERDEAKRSAQEWEESSLHEAEEGCRLQQESNSLRQQLEEALSEAEKWRENAEQLAPHAATAMKQELHGLSIDKPAPSPAAVEPTIKDSLTVEPALPTGKRYVSVAEMVADIVPEMLPLLIEPAEAQTPKACSCQGMLGHQPHCELSKHGNTSA